MRSKLCKTQFNCKLLGKFSSAFSVLAGEKQKTVDYLREFLPGNSLKWERGKVFIMRFPPRRRALLSFLNEKQLEMNTNIITLKMIFRWNLLFHCSGLKDGCKNKLLTMKKKLFRKILRNLPRWGLASSRSSKRQGSPYDAHNVSCRLTLVMLRSMFIHFIYFQYFLLYII